jgi:hypothetical protein
MITFGWFGERGKLPGSPVKLAGINHDSSDGCTMTTYPLGSRMNDNIGTVIDGSDDISSLLLSAGLGIIYIQHQMYCRQ